MAETNVDRVTLEISISDTASAKIDDLTSKIQNLINQVNILNKLDINTENFGKATPQVERLSQKMDDVSKSTKDATKNTDKLKDSTKSFGKSAKSTTSALGKLTAAIKRIIFYRFIRSAIREVTEAIKEGINNAYLFSKQFGDKTFAQNMDNMSSSLLYFKNSIGAVSLQLLNSLLPTLSQIIDKIADFNNKIAELIAYLKGEKTYTKAIKLSTEYAKATNEVAKANRNAVASFDELNVISTSKSKNGSTGNIGQMFEEALVDAVDVEKTLSNLKKIGAVLAGLGLAKLIWDIVKAMRGKNSVLGEQTTKTGKETSAVKSLVKVLVPAAVAVGAYALAFGKIPEWVKTTVKVVEQIPSTIWDFFTKTLPNWVKTTWIVTIGVSILSSVTKFFRDTLPKWKSEAAEKIETVITINTEKWLETKEKIKKFFGDTLPKAAKSAAKTMASWFAKAPLALLIAYTKVRGFFDNFGKNIGNTIKGGTSSTTKNNATAAVGVSGTIGAILSAVLSALAFEKGGFPTTGQMFIARESGAEFVGNIGNRTAVANNDQIVEAVSLGVYNAVMDAMSNSQRNQGKQNIIINGREIFSVVQEESALYKRRTGQAAF